MLTQFRVLVLLKLLSNCQGHLTPAYSHETGTDLKNPSWMSKIPNNTFLSDISIPGTHESLAFSYGGAIAHCQTLPLISQLLAGIRALDIRCRHIENVFAIHHGIIFEHIYFGDVLKEIKGFLEQNPSEVILMRLKEEYSPFNNTRSFQETLEDYRESFPTLFWKPQNGNSPLTLGPVRGQILLLGDFENASEFGLNFRDFNLFKIQDHYDFKTNWDLYPKWELVKEQINLASDSYGSDHSFFINFLSGSTGSFPYFVASGHISSGSATSRLSTGFTTLTSKNKYPDFPRVDCILSVICTIAFEGTNVLAYQLIQRQEKDIRRVGILMVDFPGDGFIYEVIRINFLKNESHERGLSFIRLLTWGLSIALMIFFWIAVYLGMKRLMKFYYWRTSKSNPSPPRQITIIMNNDKQKF